MISAITIPAWAILLIAPFVGSWLGVLVRRWPEGRSVAWSRSQCEECGHSLGPFDLMPLASFVLLRGRCRHCTVLIDRFHPMIELAALVVAAVVVAIDGNRTAWLDAILGWALLTAAWIDAETFRLPDAITLPLILAGLGVTWLYAPAAVYDHAMAAALGYLGFRLLNDVYRMIRHRDGIGSGDAKLLAAAGSWLGVVALPHVILSAGIIGIGMIAVRDGFAGLHANRSIAFGPALALAFFICRLMVS